MKDNFEHILQDKLRDFSVKAGPRDWTAIERSLGLDVNARKRVPLYRYAAAAAAIVLLAVGGFYLWRVEPSVLPDTPPIAHAAPVREDFPPATDSTPPDVAESEVFNTVRKLKDAIDRANTPAVPVYTAMLSEAETVVSNGQPAVADPQGQSAVTGETGQRVGQTGGSNNFTRNAGTNNNFPVASDTRRNNASRRTPNGNWGLSLFANGVGGGRNERHSTEKMLMAAFGDELYANSDFSQSIASDYLIEYETGRNAGLLMAEVAQWNHTLPLAFGFMLRKNLTEHWGVEIGVTYSYLTSKQETTSVLKKQRLHYLGVPVALTYTPFRSGAFDFYGRVGGAADFNIAGSTTLRYSGANSQTNRFTKEGVQWSVSANLGVMYNISPSVGIYFEPGVSHHFEFSNQPESYWKEHPTGFNMQVGVRTNF